MLFVVDGGKAAAKAIRDVYGGLAPIQRCRRHYPEQRIMPTWMWKALRGKGFEHFKWA